MREYKVNGILHRVFDDIDELPTPKGEQEIVQNDDNFKEIIKSKKTENKNLNTDINSSLKDSI